MAELVPKYLDQDVVRVVLGAVPETTKLLELPWDHILYTGSGRVGKIVNMAGAKTLSPVSLELGGKSPAVIDPKCDMRTAAKRILWGKVANAGQTCVAPDYVLIERGAEDKLVEALKEAHKSFFPDKSFKEMSRIVAPSHFTRLKGLVEHTQGTVVLGGLDEMDEAGKLITPTIVRGVKEDDSLMSEEIFGPILPILPVDNVDDALEYINKHDHPLALYVFTQDAAFKAKVFDNTTSGSAVANEVLFQCATDGLPFGGIGPSGNGYQTRKYAFDMFTHLRASLDSPSWLDKIMGARYPPYTSKKLATFETLLGVKLPARPANNGRISAATHGKASSIVARRGWTGAIVIILGVALAALVKREGGMQNAVGWIVNVLARR